MIQWAAVPVPEVGKMPRLTAKTRMPTIATQKSGALAHQRHEAGEPVEQAAGPGGSQRADDKRQRAGQGDRHHGELQRLRKGFQRHRHRRPVLAQRLPEIEMEEVAEIVEELDIDGLVEAVEL